LVARTLVSKLIGAKKREESPRKAKLKRGFFNYEENNYRRNLLQMADDEELRTGRAYYKRGDVGCAHLAGRWHLDKAELKKMLFWEERHLVLWEQQCGREPSMMLNVPPLRENSKPRMSFWGFRNPIVSDTVSVECAMYFSRRGTPATERELDELVVQHLQSDGMFLLNVMLRLFVKKVNNLMPILEGSVRRLYLVADRPDARPERPFVPRECVKCGNLGRHKQCGCKMLVYYCSKRCQMADWPRHRMECSGRGGAQESAPKAAPKAASKAAAGAP
jgi:hypothetical protein